MVRSDGCYMVDVPSSPPVSSPSPSRYKTARVDAYSQPSNHCQSNDDDLTDSNDSDDDDFYDAEEDTR